MIRSLTPLIRILPILLIAAALAAARATDAGPLAPVLQKSIDDHIVGGAVGLVADKEHVLDLEAVG